MKDNTEKTVEKKENREVAERSIFGDILQDLKGNWWKYLLSFATGAAATFGGVKLLDKHFAEEPETEEEEPTPWEGPADISEE